MANIQPTKSQLEISRLKETVSNLQQVVAGVNAGEPIYVGQYLLARLEQLGVTVSPFVLSILETVSSFWLVQHMFGVPGDFNLGKSFDVQMMLCICDNELVNRLPCTHTSSITVSINNLTNDITGLG